MATRPSKTPAKASAEKAPARSARASRPEGNEAAATGGQSSVGLAETLLIVSTVLLIAAILMTDKFMGSQFGEGMFFKS